MTVAFPSAPGWQQIPQLRAVRGTRDMLPRVGSAIAVARQAKESIPAQAKILIEISRRARNRSERTDRGRLRRFSGERTKRGQVEFDDHHHRKSVLKAAS